MFAPDTIENSGSKGESGVSKGGFWLLRVDLASGVSKGDSGVSKGESGVSKGESDCSKGESSVSNGYGGVSSCLTSRTLCPTSRDSRSRRIAKAWQCGVRH